MTELITRRRLLAQTGSTGLFVATSPLITDSVSAQETGSAWPMFSHDIANTGHAPDGSGPIKNIERRWSFETGSGIASSPAVIGGTVYIGSGDASIYALSTADGTEQWTYETNSGIASSPAVIDGTVFVGSSDNNVYAVSAEDGSERWRYETDGGVFSSPTVVDGTVFVGGRDGMVYALSATDGTEQWTYETNDEIWSSPAVANGTVFIGSRDNNVYALSSADGSKRWSYETNNWVESSPAVVDDTVYVGSLDERVYALSATDGSEQWKTQLDDVVASSPAVANGTVFVGCRDDKLYALSTADGTEQWAHKTGGRVFSSPAVVDDIVYVGSADNAVYALSAAEGRQHWRYETDSAIFSSPAVVDGTVYIGSSDASVHVITGSEPTPVQTMTGMPSQTSVQTSLGGGGDKRGQSSGLPAFAPLVLSILGLGGGGAWWIHSRRGGSQNGDSEGVTGSASTNSSDISEPASGTTDDGSPVSASIDKANADTTTADNGETISAGDTESMEPSADSKEEHPTDEDPFRGTVLGPSTDSRVDDSQPSAFARMVPETVPRAPSIDVEYDALGEETPIGSGGNADVTRVVYPTSDGEVTIALKKPRISGTLHIDDIEQVLAEAETWDKLDDHDHIVAVIDYGSDPLPWIAMEYMDGGDLTGYIGEMDVPQAVWTALAVTKGVRHAHRLGVAHLDLKPENVLFRSVEDAWNVPKVADWGLSKHLLDHSKSVEGLSPHYAAPEQFDEDFGPTDDITDVYQLGAVFYEMFTGQPPFTGSPTQVMRAVMDEEPTPPSELADVPPALDDILLTCLEKSRSERYDSLVYLRDALQSYALEYL